jgi:hypothetical protein
MAEVSGQRSRPLDVEVTLMAEGDQWRINSGPEALPLSDYRFQAGVRALIGPLVTLDASQSVKSPPPQRKNSRSFRFRQEVTAAVPGATWPPPLPRLPDSSAVAVMFWASPRYCIGKPE